VQLARFLWRASIATKTCAEAVAARCAHPHKVAQALKAFGSQCQSVVSDASPVLQLDTGFLCGSLIPEATLATKTFIVDCPYCKAKVAAEETGRAEETGFDDGPSEPYGLRVHVGNCPRCKTPLAAQSQQLRFKGWEDEDEDVWSDPVRVHPKPPKTFSSFRIPSTVTKSLSEADVALQGNASLAACVMFGRALEALCRDVLYTPEEKKAVRAGTSKKRMMLAEGIKQLKEKDFIDSRLFDWSQHLHAFRNLAAHSDSDAAITREDAEDLQAFVYAIIEYIYDLADRYKEFKERQDKRARAKKNATTSIWGDDA
jgi:Domain of unknown function (DUF4145)